MEFREITERYDLAKILHSGRSGTILLGTDRSTRQTVAVKMIVAGPGPLEEAAARFEAFGAALGVIRHPGLPVLLDSGISPDGSAFLVLELLEGRTLDTMVGKLEPVDAVKLLGQALGGLEALAVRGLAHGNLTPENLFVATGGAVKLLGLGSAAFRGLRGAGGVSAASPESARFLAPELAAGGVPTSRSDLHTFALVACHVLGATVEGGDSPSVQMPFAVTLDLANDAALRTVLERLLQSQPAERPSFREVRAALRQALGAQPAASAESAPPSSASSLMTGAFPVFTEAPAPPPIAKPAAPPAPAFVPPAVSVPSPAPEPLWSPASDPDLADPDPEPSMPAYVPRPAAAPAPAASAVETGMPALGPLLGDLPDLDKLSGGDLLPSLSFDDPPRPAPPPVRRPAPAPPAPLSARPSASVSPADGELLSAITDEVLNALDGGGPPPPVAPSPVMAGRAASAAAPEKPPVNRQKLALLFGGLAALLLIALLVGVWWLYRTPSDGAAPVSAEAPPPPAAASPQAVMVRVNQALVLLAQGDEDKARKMVEELSYSDQSGLSPEACARLTELEGTLEMLALERLPEDLERGLAAGDLGMLRATVGRGAGLGSALPAELRGDFETAKRLVELHRLAEVDAAEGKHAAVLQRMSELRSLSSRLTDPLDLREKAAAAIEKEAEELAMSAQYDLALGRLEPLLSTWSDRPGLTARAAGYRSAREDEAKQQALLDAIPAWERRRKPHEPLEALSQIKPTPHLAAKIEEARKRLEEQLATLDMQPPTVELRPGFGLEYSRGNPVRLEFKVRDDYEVRGVTMWARPPGGKMREMRLQHHKGISYWSVDIPVSYHQNGTVELYLKATDRSGHEGWFGTTSKPMKLTRIGSDRL